MDGIILFTCFQMKLRFSSSDSIYKIFSTLEKLLPWKRVDIVIEEGHPIFDNIWRGLQLKDLLNKKKISYNFVPQSGSQQKYFEEAGLQIKTQKKFEPWWQKWFKSKLAKSPSISLPPKGTYRFYIVLLLELLLVGFVLKFFIWMLNVSAYVYLKPSFEVKDYVYPFLFYQNNLDVDKFVASKDVIYMPYYTGKLQRKLDLSMPVEDVKYISQKAVGVLKIQNYTPISYPLRATTRFVTDDGLVFRSKHWVNIPGGTTANPWVAYVEVQADDYDENGHIIGVRGNIGTWTRLYIRNLKVSFADKKIIAYPTKPFKWGKTQKQWTITSWDIQNFKIAMLKKFEKDFPKIVRMQSRKYPDRIVLPARLATGKLVDLAITTPIGSDVGEVRGEGYFQIIYSFVKVKDFEAGVEKYLMQRPFEGLKMIKILTSDVQFLEIDDRSKNFDLPPKSILRIITNFKIVAGYDFDKDINLIKEELKSKILGKTKDEAIKIIRQHPQINWVWIKLSPPWYDKLPKLKSRIYFRQQK